MFISDKICFVEFGKTGCSFIREIFSKKIKDGVLTKIHDPITDELILSDKIKVGSIRNPYDWYISLWSFGCLMQKRDPLFSNLTRRKLNPKRIIIANDYHDPRECIKYILSLTEEDFDNYEKEPIFTNEKESEIFRELYNRDSPENKKLIDNMKYLLDDILSKK